MQISFCSLVAVCYCGKNLYIMPYSLINSLSDTNVTCHCSRGSWCNRTLWPLGICISIKKNICFSKRPALLTWILSHVYFAGIHECFVLHVSWSLLRPGHHIQLLAIALDLTIPLYPVCTSSINCLRKLGAIASHNHIITHLFPFQFHLF